MRAATVTVIKNGKTNKYVLQFADKKHYFNWRDKTSFYSKILSVEFHDDEWFQDKLAREVKEYLTENKED